MKKYLILFLFVSLSYAHLKAQNIFTSGGFTFTVKTGDVPPTKKVGDTVFVNNCIEYVRINVSPANSEIFMKKNGSGKILPDHLSDLMTTGFDIYDIFNGASKLLTVKLISANVGKFLESILVDGTGREVPLLIDYNYLSQNNFSEGLKYKESGNIVTCDKPFVINLNGISTIFDRSKIKIEDSFQIQSSFAYCKIKIECGAENIFSKTYKVVGSILSVQETNEGTGNLSIAFSNENSTIFFNNIPSELRNQSFQILDSSGNLVKTKIISPEVQISDLSSGMYFLILETSNAHFIKRISK